MKFFLTARTLAYRMRNNMPLNSLTALNIKKVTQGRENGIQELRGVVAKMVEEPETYLVDARDEPDRQLKPRARVYPDPTERHPDVLAKARRDERRRTDPLWNSRPHGG
jgi:hypothetical protein